MHSSTDPNQEINQIWTDDLLSRSDDAKTIIRFVNAEIEDRKAAGRNPSYVLNVDARWGEGKTFFLSRLKRHLEALGHKVAYINAWEDDHADDPLISFVSELDSLITKGMPVRSAARKKWGRAKSILPSLLIRSAQHALTNTASKFIGKEAVQELSESLREALEPAAKAGEKTLELEAERLIKSFETKKSSIHSFRELLAGIAGDESLPIYILIDELDRCRPTYAILLLERIKHLFETNNVAFVVATDSRQLANAIKVVYGNDFDSRSYLKRFFARSYVFPEPSLSQFIDNFLSTKSQAFKSKLSSPPNNNHSAFIALWAQSSELSLRDLEQCMDLLSTMLSLWDESVPVELVYALPLIILHHKGDRSSFRRLSELKELSEWSTLLPHGVNQRTIDFGVGRDGQRAHANVEILLKTFLAYATMQLHEIASMTYTSSYSEWITRRLESEFQILHQMRWNGSKSPKSVASKYATYIEGASHLQK